MSEIPKEISATNTNEMIGRGGENPDSSVELCVVCYKNLEIYSIGDCDHPVCFECSTRMRVLCEQNECPICRQSLAKVIFTLEKRTYKDLEMNNRSGYYNKKYKIAFSNIKIQEVFYNLLDHPCNMCNCPPFHSFDALRDHVRREHEKFYCDICTDNLKIFSFERKCYSRQELATHRRKGDPDNTSHRGHPLCQYCDCRYLDRDELFRHLRREHFFCHFCDADGSNEFYADYDSLRKHFKSEHYLCEEGDCAREQFTSVFRSDIDLRAHIANVHGKSLNKMQAKQARTLQLEITLGPRGRSDNPGANLRSRNENNGSHQLRNNYHSAPLSPAMIDAKNEQEFPSLSGASATAPTAVTLIGPMMKRFGQAGLARTKENFPALGNNVNNDSGGMPDSGHKINSVSASTLLKSTSSKSAQNKQQNNNSTVIHVSNRPIANTSKQLSNQKDYPALPLSKQQQKNFKLNEDMPTSNNYSNLNVSAKHRPLLDDYVSIANSSNLQAKIQLIQQQQEEQNKFKQPESPIKLRKSDFPALGTPVTASTTSLPVWKKSQREKDLESRRSKVAPAPNLKIYEKHENERMLPNKNLNKSSDFVNNNNHIKKQDGKKNNDFPKLCDGGKQNLPNNDSKKQSIKNKNNENNNENQKKKNSIVAEQKKLKNNLDKILGTAPLSNKNELSLPPGFGSSSNLKVPPGFQTVTLNSTAKSPNNLNFTSLSENFSILPTSHHVYIPPPNNADRNKELISHFYTALNNSEEAVKEFKFISQKFREGVYKTDAYYGHCESALKSKFDDIFPELLALLPDITKQQELYLVHTQNLNKLKRSPNKNQKLEVCSSCKQILKSIDFNSHVKSHNLDLNFPSLGK